MRNDRIQYVVVGGVVLATLAGLIFALALLAGRTGATETYYTRFERVNGLAYGTQVLYQGYRIGQIEAIEPRQEAGKPRFRVELALQRGWPIDREAQVRIQQSGFLGALVLDIQGGGADESWPPGSEIASREAPDMLALVQDVAHDIDALMEKTVRPVVESVGAEAPALLASARRFADRLEAASARVDELLDERNMKRMDNVVRNAETISGDLAGVTGELGETRRRLDETMAALQELVETNSGQVGEASADLKYTLETIARSVDSITYNLESMSRNMSEFSREVRGNPGVLLRGTEPPPPPAGGSGE